MRILHTADWHLGARLGRHERVGDHEEALRGLLGLARSFQPDWIVHAGDVFDVSHPAHETLRLALESLDALSEHAPVTVVGGNHDPRGLLDALDGFARRRGRRMRLVTTPCVLRPVPGLEVIAVPFVTAGEATDGLAGEPDEIRSTYAAWIRRTIKRLETQAAETRQPGDAAVRVYAAHLHVAGARPGRSERRVTITDEYAADAEGASDVDYSAYGHIHDAQTVGAGANAWYAGSLIPLDFGEATIDKTTNLVSVTVDGTSVQQATHGSGRPLVDFRGTADELRRRAAEGGLDSSILRAAVRSPARIYDLASSVLDGSPRAAIHELTNEVANAAAKQADDANYDDGPEPALAELYDMWRKGRTSQQRGNDEQAGQLLGECLRNADTEATSDFGIGAFTALEQAARRLLAKGPVVAGADERQEEGKPCDQTS